MTRAELLRRFVLNSVCDDTEDLEHVYYDFYRSATWCVTWIERADVMDALIEAIEDGYVKAYRVIEGRPAAHLGEVQGVPALEEMETPHAIVFGLTPKGRALHLSEDDGLPWDENGNLREGWTEPKD